MESFVGSNKGDREQKANSKHIIKNTNSPEVELFFFELIEMSYDDLLDMYNDYSQMYEAFNDYKYKLNARIVMGAIETKGAKDNNKAKDKEVNVS
jgi:hypothetical protein